jgi:hypothetical protein
VGVDFDLVAASLRADEGDLAVFVESLATKLEGALPRRTQVRRRRRGFLSKEQQVEEIAVELGDDRYVLRYDGRDVDTRCAKAVRGVVLKTEPLPLDRWIDALARTLAGQAGESEQGREALARLLEGR